MLLVHLEVRVIDHLFAPIAVRAGLVLIRRKPSSWP